MLALLQRLRQASDSPQLVLKAFEEAAEGAEEGTPTPAAQQKAHALCAPGADAEDCPVSEVAISGDLWQLVVIRGNQR